MYSPHDTALVRTSVGLETDAQCRFESPPGTYGLAVVGREDNAKKRVVFSTLKDVFGDRSKSGNNKNILKNLCKRKEFAKIPVAN